MISDQRQLSVTCEESWTDEQRVAGRQVRRRRGTKVNEMTERGDHDSYRVGNRNKLLWSFNASVQSLNGKTY